MKLGPLVIGVSLAASAAAQESSALFDAPVVILNAFDDPFQHLADFDGDGVLDAISYWPTVYNPPYRYLRFHKGKRTGSFDLYTHFIQLSDRETPDARARGAVGEIRGPDGLADLAFAFGTRLEVIQSGASGPLIDSSHVLPWSALDVAVADFDGDGRGDVAVLGARAVRGFLHPADTGSLLVNQELPERGWRFLETGEFTGDGVTDLAIVGMDSVRILSLTSGGTDGHARRALEWPHGLMLPDPAAGDLEGDGDDDLVLFTKTSYRILRQYGPGRLRLERERSGGPASDLADVDGDGDLDGICCGGGGGGTPLINRLISRFEISLQEASGFAPAFSIPGSGAEHIAGAADLDGDGDVELVAGRTIYYPREPLARPDFLPAGEEPPDARDIADVDLDGDPDFGLSVERVLLNLGDGTSIARAPVLPDPPAGARWVGPGYPGDFSGDGAVDLLAEAWDGSLFLGVHQLVNSGGGSFVDGGLVAVPAAPWSLTRSLTARASLAEDLDGDGDLDLVVRSLPGAPLGSELWWNDGPAGFSPGPVWDGERVLAAADLTADGLVDLVVGAGGLELREGTGSRTFAAPRWIESGEFPSADEFRDDLDDVAVAALGPGNSGLDVLAAQRHPMYVYRYFILEHSSGSDFASTWVWPGTPLFSLGMAADNPLPYGESDSGKFAHALDVDGNGLTDLVTGPAQFIPNGSFVLLRHGTYNWNDETAYPLVFQAHAFADVDGDGDQDALTDRVVRSRVNEGKRFGLREQYGEGTAGTGGVLPTLGIDPRGGRFAIRSTVEFRISGARGGAGAYLVLSRAPAEVHGSPIPGVTTLVDTADPHFVMHPISLDGAPGAAGAGSLRMPYTVPIDSVGVHEYLQVLVADPGAPGGFAATQGLHVYWVR